MWLLDLLHHFINAETYVCGYGNDYCWDCLEEYGSCPATAFTSVAAAFATQGYWVQSDLLDMLTFSNMAALGPLIYVISAIGGLIGVAINQPPRIYMWFFLGPALYGWLIDARQEVNGVQWQVGMRQLDQREVWKLSEVGLLNTNMAKRLEDWGSGHGISSSAAPQPVYAANFFVWYDSVLSGITNGLIDWAGPYTLKDNSFADTSNVGDASDFVGQQEAFRNDRWFLLSNLKWAMLQNVTNAKVTSASLRDAFATFVGGLCGEQLYGVVDEGAFVAAAHGRGDNIPSTIFMRSEAGGGPGPNDMAAVLPVLKVPSEGVSLPEGLTSKGIFKNLSEGSFYDSIGGESWPVNSPYASFAGILGSPVEEYIRCDQYLMLLILAFRWEAFHIYHQMVLKTPEISNNTMDEFEEQEKKFLYNFFYGWNLKRGRTDADPGVTERKDPYSGTPLSWGEKRQFLVNLILMHLVRNEFAIVKQPVDVRRLGADLAVNYSEGQMRTVGSISKFGEVYSWAILMPYLQGVLMYFLAIAYPFACLMMLVPGMHKSLFTWMSFWAWVKIWDVGFALVMALERSVWAMVGNSSKAAGLFDKIIEVNEFGSVSIGGCSSSNGCAVRSFSLSSAAYDFIGPSQMLLNDEDLRQNLRIFDRALALGPSLDLDLSNSYYIYIMAALYLAVPAVTGQLVLGARAGAASMLTQAIGQNAQEAGRAAASGYTGDITQRLKSNASSIGQATYAAYMQKSNLASQAIETSNKQVQSGIEQSRLGAWRDGLSYKGDNVGQWAGQWGKWGEAYRSQQGFLRDSKNAPAELTGQLGPGIGTAGRAWSTLNNVGYAAAAAKIDAAMAPVGIKAAEINKEMNQAKSGLNAGQFENGAMSSALNRGAGLKSSQAQFGAEMARWNAVNQMANQLGGASAAVGVFSGTLDPGQKPTSMDGMAMNGMLGSSAKENANAFNPFGGSIFGKINSDANELRDATYADASKMPAPDPQSAGQYFNAGWDGFFNDIWDGKKDGPGGSSPADTSGAAAPQSGASGLFGKVVMQGDPANHPGQPSAADSAKAEINGMLQGFDTVLDNVGSTAAKAEQTSKR